MSLTVTDTSSATKNTAVWAGVGQEVWAVSDQLIISATNFITTVLLARGLSQLEFGAFALGLSVVLFAANLQFGLVTQPHNVLGAAKQGQDYVRYTTSTAFGQLLLVGLLLVVGFVSWLIVDALGGAAASIILALLPLAACWQLQEMVRRFLYTEGRITAALVNDVLTYGTRGLVIASLWWLDRLTVTAAFYGMAAASFLGLLLGIWQIRKQFTRRIEWSVLRDNWHYGKWLAGTEIVGFWLSSQLFIYLAAGILGVAVVGVLKAVDVVFGPARVLASVFNSVLPIRFSHTLATRGESVCHRQLKRAMFLALPLFGAYCALIAVFSDFVLRILFGATYVEFGPVLALYSLCAFFGYVSGILGTALRAKRLTRQVFTNRLIASLFAIPIGWSLIHALGIYGAVLGMVATYSSLCLLFWSSYRRDRQRSSVPIAPECTYA